MNIHDRLNLLKKSGELHSQVEAEYFENIAKIGDDLWLEKQRILLADMALHLFQTSMKPDKIDLEKLRNNIHSILTISDQFLPNAHLKKATEKLYQK